MAKTATITDQFPGSSFAATWAAFNNMTCSNEALATINADTTVYSVLQTAVTYDATASTAVSQLTSAGNQSITSLEVYALQLFLGGGANSNSNVALYINQGRLSASWDTGAGFTAGTTVTYNPALHRFFMISEASGTTTWATSWDGQHFTPLYSAADPITLTAITVQLAAGTYAMQGTATTVTWASCGAYAPVAKPKETRQAVKRAAFF